MDYERMVKLQAEAAMAFGQLVLRTGHEVQPMVVVTKPGSEDTLLMSPRPFDDDDKEGVFAMMAVAARYWGGTDVLIMLDAYVRTPQPGEVIDLKNLPPPSQDPLASEALMVHVFRADHDDFGYVMKYEHTPSGLRFHDQAELPTGPMAGGMMPLVIHSALSKTDEQLDEMKAGSPVPIDTIEDYLKLLSANGYSVTIGRYE